MDIRDIVAKLEKIEHEYGNIDVKIKNVFNDDWGDYDIDIIELIEFDDIRYIALQ